MSINFVFDTENTRMPHELKRQEFIQNAKTFLSRVRASDFFQGTLWSEGLQTWLSGQQTISINMYIEEIYEELLDHLPLYQVLRHPRFLGLNDLDVTIEACTMDVRPFILRINQLLAQAKSIDHETIGAEILEDEVTIGYKIKCQYSLNDPIQVTLVPIDTGENSLQASYVIYFDQMPPETTKEEFPLLGFYTHAFESNPVTQAFDRFEMFNDGRMVYQHLYYNALPKESITWNAKGILEGRVLFDCQKGKRYATDYMIAGLFGQERMSSGYYSVPPEVANISREFPSAREVFRNDLYPDFQLIDNEWGICLFQDRFSAPQTSISCDEDPFPGLDGIIRFENEYPCMSVSTEVLGLKLAISITATDEKPGWVATLTYPDQTTSTVQLKDL